MGFQKGLPVTETSKLELSDISSFSFYKYKMAKSSVGKKRAAVTDIQKEPTKSLKKQVEKVMSPPKKKVPVFS